jgi:hypothetical protein
MTSLQASAPLKQSAHSGGGPTLRQRSRNTLTVKTSRRKAPKPEAADAPNDDGVSTVSASNLSLHDLFEQQARHYLERADLDEEQKQTILVALSCPCCGAGGMSFSVKVKD